MNRKARIFTVPLLQDNLAYIVHREDSKSALVIDPSEPTAVIKELERQDLELRLILNTHHHHDHVGGNIELSELYGAPVWCSDVDLARVPRASRGLKDGDNFEFDGLDFTTLAIPGHTQGQIAYFMPKDKAVFVGDTVFAMGCGRLMEGSPEQMWSSLSRLKTLPGDTKLYFGHEYTRKNASFALMFDPQNRAIEERLANVIDSLSSGRTATAPTLDEEILINPFLNPRRSASALHLEDANDLEVFTELRRRRNTY